MRIVQHLAPDRCLIGLAPGKRRTLDASDNRTVPFADIARSKEEATNPAADPRPRRIQLRRSKGARMPENTVSVARPTAFGNPWKASDFTQVIGEPSAAAAIEIFRCWVKGEPHWGLAGNFPPAPMDLSEIKGKNLACWCRLCDAHALGKPHGTDCPDCEPCHADVLLELANG